MTSVRGIGPLPALISRMEGPDAVDYLFSQVGLSPDVVRETDRMVPLDNLIALYEVAADMTGDPLFGLKVGQEMVDAYGTWVAYSRTAPTLRACLQRAARSIAYHQTGTALTVSTNGARSKCVYRIFGPKRADRLQHIQHTIPALLRSFQIYAGHDWKPDWIELDVDHDQRVEELGRRLCVPLLCGSPAMALAFPTALLDLPRQGDYQCAPQVGRHELKTMVMGRPPTAFAKLVREAIHLDLLDGAAQMDGVARRLGLGPRTVQRRLRSESRSFRALVFEVRMERAKALLVDTEMPITEIAFRLGYSDSNHLTRAFTQSQKMSPSAFRTASKRLRLQWHE